MADNTAQIAIGNGSLISGTSQDETNKDALMLLSAYLPFQPRQPAKAHFFLVFSQNGWPGLQPAKITSARS
jgi:hypothetical protein